MTTTMTPDIPERLKRFEIPGRVTLLEGNGELPKIEVISDWSTAEIYLLGAHVNEFKKKGEPPVLFTSKCSRFAHGQAIRGGVPIIFPWFGPREASTSHGFARHTEWDLHETITVPNGGVSLRFGFPGTAESAMWPAFSANYVVTVTDTLVLELILTNASADQELSIENCFHTYLAVGDIHAVSVAGLQGAAYLDKVEHFARKTEGSAAIPIESEVDRIYLDATGPVEVLDRSLRRRIRIAKSGSASTVLWNPWMAQAQQMTDFGNEEYKSMLCVESGNVGQNKLVLLPGTSSVLRVELSTAAL
jgi:D-hexose-6-phosphate mutarotase